MSSVALARRDEISLFAIATVLLRNVRRIIVFAVLGGAVAIAPVLFKKRNYKATAAFMPAGQTDAGKSGLAGIAGQFGVNIPTTNQGGSPDFYVMLLESPTLLVPLANDSVTVAGGRRAPVASLFDITATDPAQREEKTVAKLREAIDEAVDKPTGVVRMSVATRDRAASLGIATVLLDRLNQYNTRLRQDQASAERKFFEGRLTVARADLRAAEDQLQEFLGSNRALGSSPELFLQRDRLQRNVQMQQQIFTSLMQSYEESRIREVRDMPVIAVVEPPLAGHDPEPLGRVTRGLVGIMLGALVGMLIALVQALIVARRRQGDPAAAEFLAAIASARGKIGGRSNTADLTPGS